MSTETKPLEGAKKTLDGGTGEMFDAIAGRYDLLNRIMSVSYTHLRAHET